MTQMQDQLSPNWKNQLNDLETLHKVRILINMKVSFHEWPTGLGSAY